MSLNMHAFSALWLIFPPPLARSKYSVLITVRCGVVWCGVVWCGVVWCGVVWCGVVWCGVVWCGVVCRRRCYQKAMAGMSTHGYR